MLAVSIGNLQLVRGGNFAPRVFLVRCWNVQQRDRRNRRIGVHQLPSRYKKSDAGRFTMRKMFTWNLRRVFGTANVHRMSSWDVFDAVGCDVEVIVQSLRRWNVLCRWIRLVHALPAWNRF